MQPTNTLITTSQALTLAEHIRAEGLALGFQAVRFGVPDAARYSTDFQNWLDAGYHGEMDWLERNSDKRFHPTQLLPGTQTVITVRMDYLPENDQGLALLTDSESGYIARYALGRDYHKVLRKRLAQFGAAIETVAGKHGYRPFVDSAPVMERQLAEQSGLGWIGKNTLLLATGSGSWFFLGELFTDLALPADPPLPQDHCGTCNQCLVDCPTDAFVGPGLLDANKCISYLTIEFKGSIPLDLRPKIGNRIYGCDDCQLVCPHNRKAPSTQEADFKARHNLDGLSLTEAFEWSESEFLKKTEGSAIRRIGFEQWQRNVAIALGNGAKTDAKITLLKSKLNLVSPLVDEHILWALNQLNQP